jgi:hypothetical protein
MLYIAERFTFLLIPFLAIGSALLLAMLIGLVVQRGVDELGYRRRQRTIATYRPFIDDLIGPNPSSEAILGLARSLTRDRAVIGKMLLMPLGVATGSVVEQLRNAARVLGFIDVWTGELAHRRWWVRAEAARALGLVRESRSTMLLVKTLDDEHEEVRAAAVEALGLLGDRRAIDPLLARLPDQSRHQRARIIEALGAFGDAATPALVAHGRAHPEDAAMVADLLGLIAGVAAVTELGRWMASDRPDVRTAALRALGTIGLDDQTFRHAVDGLDDPSADVRAMAARAIGRAHRYDAAILLAPRLDDEWLVAAHAADALRKLGPTGLHYLQARTKDEGPAGDLARQMLWERQLEQVSA